MIYTSARWADEAHTMVIGTDAEGNSETVPADHSVFRVPKEGPTGFVRSKQDGGVGGMIEPYEAPEPLSPVQVLGPISAATVRVIDGEVTGLETALNFFMAFMIDLDTYWLLFSEPQENTDYLVLTNAQSFQRGTDYLEIVAPNLAEVSIGVWRIKNG